jgi:hypothetical protein
MTNEHFTDLEEQVAELLRAGLVANADGGLDRRLIAPAEVDN